MTFQAFYRSCDRTRVISWPIVADDIDTAAARAIDMMPSIVGGGAAWFVAGIVQEDCIAEIGAAIEEAI